MSDDRPSDSVTAPAPPGPPSPQPDTRQPRQPRSWHPWRWVGGLVVFVVLLLVLAVGVVWWALATPTGTAKLLSLAPGVTVTAPKGALLGDFSADRIDAKVPGTGDVTLDAPSWRQLGVGLGDHGRWLRLGIDKLHVDRIVFTPSTETKPKKSKALAEPASLRVPVEVVVGDASIGELRIGGPEAVPVRDIHARIHIGADGGAQHRFEDLAATYDKIVVTGAATIGADKPFPVDAKISAAGAQMMPPWQAGVAAKGPLAALNVAVQAQVDASKTHPAQSLDAQAVVKPFAAWPLGELRASTEALDLSAFAAAAPATSLSGTAVATTSGIDQPASVSIDLRNARAGRYDQKLLPLRSLLAEISTRPDDPSVIEVKTLVAELGSAKQPAGRVVASGRYETTRATLELELQKLRPSLLDARAPKASLDGTVSIVGTGLAKAAAAASGASAAGASGAAGSSRAASAVASSASAAAPSATGAAVPTIEAKVKITGELLDPALPKAAPHNARITLDARANVNDITLRSFEATLGKARAAVSGRFSRSAADAPWRAVGKLSLVDFDPEPWWPGAKSQALARGPNRINAAGEFDLTLPAASAAKPSEAAATVFDSINATRGKAEISITDSALAGVPFEGEASFVNDDGRARPKVNLVAGGNHVSAQGRLAAKGSKRDEFQLSIDAPQLARLAPLMALAGGAKSAPALAGTLSVKASVDGRWPDVTSEGELHAAAVRYGDTTLRQADADWRVGSSENAKIDVKLSADDISSAGRTIERVRAKLTGTARAHRAELRVESDALPPGWVDTLLSGAAANGVPVTATTGSASRPALGSASSSTTSNATSNVAAGASAGRSALLLTAEGGLVEAGGEPAAGWRGRLIELVARSTDAPTRTWLQARDVRASVLWGGGPLRLNVEPGSAEALGATLRWKRIAYQAAVPKGPGAKLDVQATIDPIPVVPILKRLQPDFGWDGDLAIGAHISVQSSPVITADVVVERARGDLIVNQDFGKQALGLTDLRLGVEADKGVWNFTLALAGKTVGVASGAVTARTGSSTAWPDAKTPIEGVLELRIAELNSLSTWIPAGWRVGGGLHASAGIAGKLGEPEITGRIEGSRLTARNFLQGVNVTDGEFLITLKGETATIERFVAHGGDGTIRVTGDATLGGTPTADIKVTADKFQLLGRVDRRIVASGNAAVHFDAKSLDVKGGFKVDEGLIDFTRSDAPSLGDDVTVVRRPGDAPSPAVQTKALAATPAQPPVARKVNLDLTVDMGDDLKIRGKGLDARLSGKLHITSPEGRIAVAGAISAVKGTFQAYGQKMTINRAVITFVGPLDNPRLDILATRPDIEVKVGVEVTGTALNPRIRLFSEPEMSEVDKLSWLVLGKASTSAGGAESALLQRAALALLSGEGPSTTDKVTAALGLDELSVRSGEGGVRDTILSVGKQISKRWYVGYERGLNSTTGSWQLIYRLAQRFTVKASAGGDNAVDVNWTLRWK